MNNQQPTKKILKKLSPPEKHWVGDGFYVSSVFQMRGGLSKLISPFLLLDHAAPRYFEPSLVKKGVGEHPHRGFETVTFAIQGEVSHQDSGGGGGTISTGGVQWMTAGSGVVHEEFHSEAFMQSGGTFEMLQLWVNLPAKDKMKEPCYQSMSAEQFPIVDLGGAKLKVIAGSYAESKGVATTHSPIHIYEVDSRGESSFDIDTIEGFNTLVMLVHGDAALGSETLVAGELAVMDQEGSIVNIETKGVAKLMVFSGEPIDEPIAHYGPFVMNTKNELVKAMEDFQAGKMGRLVEESS